MKSIYVRKEMDSKATAELIVDCMRNYEPKDICVLGRVHYLLKKLSNELTVMGIDHTYIGKQNEFIGSEIFVRVHAFLKLLVNPYSNLDFLLIRDLLGLSRKQYNEIRLKATRESKSHFQVWVEGDIADGHFFKQYRSEWDFKDTILNLHSIMDMTDDLDKVFNFVMAWETENQNGTLEDYLDWLSVFDLQDEIKDEDTKLKLMTIHAAKGLEWPCVILIGVNEGILPSKQSIEGGDLESERRLMYVAITRARDSLIMAVRPEVKDDGIKRYENPVSRFIKELQ
jgi:ATP-dependent exoDNAse (exonuclease V) beta subunit